MKKLTIFLLFLPFAVLAQEKGMHFEHGMSWADVQAKAKAEHKFIFMDCFTTWCGPCRYMSANVFPKEDVGDFMNKNFINVKVQLDTTDADNDEVKSWYQSGHDMAKEYKVRAYPTYLFFDADGNIVHRSVGSGTPEMFLAKAGDALAPETQYYTLLKQYESGVKDSASLRKMALAAQGAYDDENGAKIAGEYLATQSDLFTKTNLMFISSFTQSSKSKGFNILLNNPKRADSVLGKGASYAIVQGVIMQEEVYPNLSRDTAKKPDWKIIATTLKQKYPALADETTAKAKVIYYQGTQNWNAYQTAIVAYMSKYSDKLNPQEMNNYAWAVFQNCSDMACMAKALEWSKKSFKDNNEPGFIDTYANILYKLGKKDEAILWEEKAKGLAAENDKQGYQDVIDKMKKGEKTWN